jgi:hypothetical protein
LNVSVTCYANYPFPFWFYVTGNSYKLPLVVIVGEWQAQGNANDPQSDVDGIQTQGALVRNV